ncbi:GDSL-type esterase/lipase family protein [Chitinophaga arvensicola]|uniref:Lysophospholipase L1 n=1 Tax=Chitinophaga arvensicola TaxID=29529 RepID=A0A1I0SAY8_9BACT|nr:GDSL-type esterase/lipase family protein [Chitinophaga arvensicola]SEW53867.1 Lysophospholipase L1 [Chitinophaga arvensicola]
MLPRFLLAAGLFLLPVAAAAQYDSTYGSSYYRQKVTQFNAIPDKENGEIIFLGDSITDIAEWSDLFKNCLIKNRGISGDKTDGILNRLTEVTTRKPSRIFLMIGINDIADQVPDSVIVANYGRIMDRIRRETPATRLIVQSILPTNDSFTEFARHQHKTEHIRFVNTAIEKMALQRQYTYVNLYDAMCDSEGKLSSDYTNDGLHLKGAGYLVWKQLLQRKKLL